MLTHFCVVYIKKLVTVLYFSIINVFWLLNICGAGGDASFAPQANLAYTDLDKDRSIYRSTNMNHYIYFIFYTHTD